MKVRPIRPHKGGRTVKRSTDVTPVTDAMLKELHEHGVSLGDIIEWAVVIKYAYMLEERGEGNGS